MILNMSLQPDDESTSEEGSERRLDTSSLTVTYQVNVALMEMADELVRALQERESIFQEAFEDTYAKMETIRTGLAPQFNLLEISISQIQDLRPTTPAPPPAPPS